jgi:hypothetical protein
VEEGGVLKKSAKFEEAWRNRRSEWNKYVHPGVTTNVIELYRSAGRKRVSSLYLGLQPSTSPVSVYGIIHSCIDLYPH